MKKTIVSLLFILIGVMLGAIATQFVEIDTGGPYYVESAAGYVTVGAYLDGVLATPHQPLQQGDQRIAISYPPFYNNPSWVTGTATYTNTGTYYTIIVPYLQNSGADDRQSNFRIDIQTWDAAESAWISASNSSSWHVDSLFQYRAPAENQYQDAITAILNNDDINILAGVYLGSLVIEDKTNVTVRGAGMYSTTIKGAGPLPAITFRNCTNVKIQNMTITSGSSEYGGGIVCDGSTVTIENCQIINNNAHAMNYGVPNPTQSYGGAIYLTDDTANNLTVKSSIIESNFANFGETAFIENGNLNFYACTLLETATSNYVTSVNSFSFWNCIISSANTSNSTFDFCCSYNSGNLPGSNNLNTDPMFVDAANGDYHLQKGSPCIGAGFFDAYCDYNGNSGNQDLITPHDETQDIGAIPYDGDRVIIYAFDDDPQGNWMCFPILDDFSYLNIGGVPYRADNIRAFFYDYEGQNSVMDQVQFRWYNTGNVYGTNTHLPDQVITWHYMAGENSDEGFLGYKAIFNSPSVMDTYHGYHIPLDRFVQIPEHTVENWIGYFLPETQTPQAAFGSYLDELHYIQHKDWTMARTMVKRGAPWVAIGDTVTLSYGDMVIVKRFAPPSIEMFQWTRGFHTSKYVREIPEYFEFNKEPEYTAVFVHMDSLTTAQEIAIMSDAQCYGAAVVNGDTVMIQAFISSLPEGSELELVAWDGAKSSANSIPIKLYDQANDTYVHCSSFIKDTSDHYLIKTGSTFDDTEVPPTLTLGIRNYPNPFNPSTTISYSVPDNGDVTITIYNAKGQLVNTLVNEYKNKGNYQVIWNGRDIKGNSVASGLYFTRLVSGGETVKNKMLLMK